MKLIVFVKSSGPNLNTDNLKDTLVSFNQRNKGVNYKFYLVIDKTIRGFVEKLFEDEIGTDKLLHLETADEKTWPQDFNIFLERHNESSEWLFITHDDVLFLTDDWFNQMTEPVSNIQDSIGWMCSTNDAPKYHIKIGLIDHSVRPGFHKDLNKWPWLLHLHNHSKRNPDYPDGAVYVHGVFSSCMLTPMKSMKKIGPCENWSKYTMLIDEDWSLRALQSNLRNVWVPHVKHMHWLRPKKRKVLNRFERSCHQQFEDKWGWRHSKKPGLEGCSIGIEALREKYKDTLIPWSSYRNSYEWQYVNNDGEEVK